MRLLILALLFCGFSYGQDVTTIHFNYKWNTKNEYKSLNKLKNTKVQYAYVEDQSDLIKQSISLYQQLWCTEVISQLQNLKQGLP